MVIVLFRRQREKNNHLPPDDAADPASCSLLVDDRLPPEDAVDPAFCSMPALSIDLAAEVPEIVSAYPSAAAYYKKL